MSNSVFNVTDPDSNDSITLVVGPDGRVSPEKELVKTFLSSRQSVDINLMTMKNVEAGKVNVTLDSLTYVSTEESEDPEEMDEIARNLMSFRMDHDYTPLTSPAREQDVEEVLPAPIEIEDELAHTLSMLEEGSLTPQVQQQEPLTKITKVIKGKKQTIFVNNKQKAKMISTGMLKEKPSETLFKKPKPLESPAKKAKSPAKTIPTESKAEPILIINDDDNLEDDEGDEDFEEPDEDFEDDENDSDFELEEEIKKKPARKVRTRSRSESKSKRKSSRPKAVEKVEPEIKPAEPPPEESKPVEKKPVPKKEKKVPKPMPDDFALFSTPDIIRRVGKEPSSPDKTTPKPAKINPEVRSKSNNDVVKRLSTDKSPGRRLSLDNRKQERRPSVDLINQEPIISDEQMVPSAEDIRAIIQNENTKSFTSNLVIPESADLGGTQLLDPALELDQSLLDNINSDLISEDILYQVAQSLVGNTELQNAIDKSINDGDIVLDPSIQSTIGSDALVPSKDTSMHSAMTTPFQSVPNNHVPLEVVTSSTPSKGGGTQIVRPDGRVVVIPPIERPTTRSRNKKKESTPPRPTKPVKKPLDEEHVSGNELDSSEDEEDESEDDPNKLWCICNQPHNNRFMICCDTCEEWYHGKCVNVTKAMGHSMEQEGKEWICVYCKDTTLKRPKAAARRIRKASRTSTDSGGGGSAKKSKSLSSSSSSLTEEKAAAPPGCVVCGKASRNSSIYCSDSCILKHAQGVEKVVVFDRKSGRLLSGSNAPNAANLDKWLVDNPTYEVVRSTTNKSVPSKPSKPASLTQSKLRIIKNQTSEGVSLAVQKRGVSIGVLKHAVKEAVQSPTHQPKPVQRKITGVKVISKTPALNQSKIKLVPASPIAAVKPPTSILTPSKPKLVQSKIQVTPIKEQKEKPIPQKTPQARKAETPVQPKQENLRDTVRKTFFEQLSNRIQGVTDLKLTDDELKDISNDIETQLYKCFGDTGQKYKNKYRSLIFNIKDAKNQTLWRRICKKSINPYQLVRLSPDDLASQELALWREREAKHQLDMIKKSELELLNCTRQYVFKTHKGEQVFEDDRPKDTVTEVISGLGADSTTEKEDEVDSNDKKNSTIKAKTERGRDRSKERSKNSREREKSKERRSSAKDHKKRSRSRDRNSRHGERKRSRSRDKHRKSSHKSSRHKKDDKSINTEKLDKKSKEILEQLVDKQIVPPLEDRLWKHVPQEDVTIAPPTIESDSDHEPSSTVTIPTPPRSTDTDEALTIKSTKDDSTDNDSGGNSPSQPRSLMEVLWKGTINMIDVAQISITAHEVSGDCYGLGEELPGNLDIVGRISPETVWDYIGKMKSSNSKTISVIRLSAINMEETMPYLALYSYLSSRNRLGVVKTFTKAIKDFYILPLGKHTPIPDPLLPLSGPGFEDNRPSLLLGVLVRDKRKRIYEGPTPSHTVKRVRVDVVPVVAPATPPSQSRSYTPPPNRDPRVKSSSVPLPVPPPELPEEEPIDDMDEPYSPEDSDPDTLPETTSSRLNADDISNLLTGSVKSSSFLDSGINAKTFEPFINKFETIPDVPSIAGLEETPTPSELQRKMALLDQEIAAQRAEIDKVSQDLVSSANSSDIGSTTLANIALPSNLQQILESIKTIGSKPDGPDSQGENSNSSNPSINADLTIPLMLPKLSSRPLIGVAAASTKPSTDITIPLNLPKIKTKTASALPQPDTEKSSSVLSSLSEEDLIKKAAEMLGEEEETPAKKARTDQPIPGFDD